jgi:hypothetical protein
MIANVADSTRSDTMTIDEALEIVRQTESCWIVFNSETGEVLSVAGDRPEETAQDMAAHLGTLSSFNQPVKTRHFKSAGVTREVLERERGESERVRTRVRVLTGWSKATTEELLQVLERGQYDYPMNKDFDSRVIVDDLWELRRDELTLPARERLNALLSRAVLCEAARNKLRIYLAALNGDEAQLKAIWTGAEPGRDCLSDCCALMDAFAFVGLKSQEINGDMLAIIESDMFFGVKYDTMIALGKIGPTAGPRAAELIRRTIHDSQPWVIAARDRVLERLVTAEDGWTVCGECCHGRVPNAKGHGSLACPACFGLGFRHVGVPETSSRGVSQRERGA